VEFLAAFGRHKAPEVVEEWTDRVLMLAEVGLIVGVAVAGPERGYPVQPFHRSFARVREAGLGIEVHAGEWSGPESVWDALDHATPDRLGHGVAIFEDPALVQRVREEGTHIEMCPTSNVCTGSVRTIEAHPIRLARDMGLDYSVNTDDPGAFSCSMVSEFRLLAETFGFTEAELMRVYENALSARFQPRLRYLDGDASAPRREG
jgi:adenosine deaminase